ncbi:hypothetical protein [Massilia sp. erpn]|uniref:hypothetical protein n=1 Tax=Massilia sp. erpn TaxID=2738142 RepID=UPI00210821F7|nr:hypothetical protein [Massilia sp. erpn]UTY58826.1 hypothetical protein HPQ68_17490 [Massilia sp. erpn]
MRWVIGIALVAVLLGVWFGFSPRNLYLVAHDVVPVFATELEAMRSGSPVKQKLKADERRLIVECIDAKHYQIYKVRLIDGEIGFVNVGNYSIERSGQEGVPRC